MMKSWIRQGYQRWLNKRLPPSADIQLNQRRLFIFLSRQGLYFIAVLLLILLAAINYQNNLIYAVVFFLFSLLNSCIIFTYLNVSGLRIRAGKSLPVFAGDVAEFEITLSAERKKQHQRIALQFAGELGQTVDVGESGEQHVKLHCSTSHRGLFKPPRLQLHSYYPLGFIRCWSSLNLDLACIVYPKPWHFEPLPGYQSHSEKTQDRHSAAGFEDFSGFKDYSPGDPLRHVNWRAYAKGLNLQSKVFSSEFEQSHWVDWDLLGACAVEERLSKLCFWAQSLEQQQCSYGLKLPNLTIAQGSGEKHQREVLRALALYPSVGGNR
jgi:uncharacterized protein (DUF58 family)